MRALGQKVDEDLAEQQAQELHNAGIGKRMGTDKNTFIRILTEASRPQIKVILSNITILSIMRILTIQVHHALYCLYCVYINQPSLAGIHVYQWTICPCTRLVQKHNSAGKNPYFFFFFSHSIT